IQALGHIAEVIGRINEIQTTISSAVEQQSATTGEMARNVTEVATGSASIAEGLVAVATSAEQTTASATATERAASQLARTADDLRAIPGTCSSGTPRSAASASTCCSTRAARSPPKYPLRKSPFGKLAPARIRPVSPPSSSATRTMTPTPCSAQAGQRVDRVQPVAAA